MRFLGLKGDRSLAFLLHLVAFGPLYYVLLLPGIELPPENVIIFTLLALMHALLSGVLPSLVFPKLWIVKCVTLRWAETFDGKGFEELYLVEICTVVNIWEPRGNVQVT